MRSWEYTDRNHQYQWFLDNLGLRKIEIVSFSRLSFNYTVLGKRHLRALVKAGLASGWDDPRFPTVRGLRRRGVQPETLRKFCEDQGASRNQNLHNWDKLWAMNRDIISKMCPRAMSIALDAKVDLTIDGVESGSIQAPILPSDPSKGSRTLAIGPRMWIAYDDANLLSIGEKVTLLHWGNLIVTAIQKDDSQRVVKVVAKWTDDRNFKGTKKINWLVPETGVKIVMREWNHLLKVKQLGEDDDILKCVTETAYVDTEVLCDPSIANAEKGSIWQLERRAEIIVDELATENSPALTFLIPTGKMNPIGLPVKLSLFTEEDAGK
jgi:glutamyl/glutaminyl-tRNA synthetase